MIETTPSWPAEKRLWMVMSLRSITSFCVRRFCSSSTFSLSLSVIKSWNACRAGPTSADRARGQTRDQRVCRSVGPRFEWRSVTCSGVDDGAEVGEERAELFDLVRGPLAHVLRLVAAATALVFEHLLRLVHTLGRLVGDVWLVVRRLVRVLGLGELLALDGPRHRVDHVLLRSCHSSRVWNLESASKSSRSQARSLGC
eukprot:scaffold71808_cov69-Phaeocystis_antarctica.AAC.4